MKEDQAANYNEVINSCEKLIEQLNHHASHREQVLYQRETLKNLVKDNAACPKCSKTEQLKHIGVDRNEAGWKSNKYKCRKCNIEFVLNRPNNPWDLLPFMEKFIEDLENKFVHGEYSEEEKQHSETAVNQMKASISKLKPVVEASDLDYKEMLAKQEEMDKLIHEFKNHLMIERIKMDTWERRQKNKPAVNKNED